MTEWDLKAQGSQGDSKQVWKRPFVTEELKFLELKYKFSYQTFLCFGAVDFFRVDL